MTRKFQVAATFFAAMASFILLVACGEETKPCTVEQTEAGAVLNCGGEAALVENGATGPAGPAGVDGLPGDDGEDGDPGPRGGLGYTGLTGDPGDDGEDGQDGATGPAGPAGTPGVDGQDGQDGADGAPGPRGPQGEKGDPGTPGRDGENGGPGGDGGACEVDADCETVSFCKGTDKLVSFSRFCKEGECASNSVSESLCDWGCELGSCAPPCDDGKVCTVDTLVDGECHHEDDLTCVKCEAAEDCIKFGENGICNGGAFHEFTGLCLEGKCELDTPISCNDGNATTTDSCTSNEGCKHEPPAPVNPCAGKICTDGNSATTDSCDPATGLCVFTPVDKCVGQPVCEDGNPCTANACDPTTGACVFTAIAGQVGATCSATGGKCAADGKCVEPAPWSVSVSVSASAPAEAHIYYAGSGDTFGSTTFVHTFSKEGACTNFVTDAGDFGIEVNLRVAKTEDPEMPWYNCGSGVPTFGSVTVKVGGVIVTPKVVSHTWVCEGKGGNLFISAAQLGCP